MQPALCISETTDGQLPTPFILPQRVYTAVGDQGSIRFSNLVYAPVAGSVLFDVVTGPGAQYREDYSWKAELPKSTPLTLKIATFRGTDFQLLEARSATLCVADLEAIKGPAHLRWLAIGDSLTANGAYVSQTLEKLAKAIPQVTLTAVGTKGPKAGNSKVRHEGRGGWSWVRYQTSGPVGAPEVSPFVFGPAEAMEFDFSRYVKEQHGGVAPEVITILLGANDLYGISGDYTAEKMQKIIGNAQAMVEKIRAAAPRSVIGIIPPPVPSDQNGFGTNYGVGVTVWQYRRALQIYISELLKTFDGRWDERIYIVPAYLAFDSEHAYPVNAEGAASNALHPTPKGYGVFSDSLFAWMSYLLANGQVDLSTPAAETANADASP